jgi:hypothetical protein
MIVPEMTLPDQVHQIVAAVARKFIDLHRGTDDDRREATKRAVQTIRARLVGQGVLDGARWVHKTQHSNLAAPSKDAIAFVPDGPVEHGRKAGMFMFDTINGTTREANPPGPGEFGEQFILVVEAKDWLADGTTPATPATQPTHRYDGGGNDTDRCDICQKHRDDPVHAIPESKVPHKYDGGEHDTGRCDICQKAKADPIHSAPAVPSTTEELLRQILEATKRQEQKLDTLIEALKQR